jgi:3-hydroxyisobutyrate dehydrogenase
LVPTAEPFSRPNALKTDILAKSWLANLQLLRHHWLTGEPYIMATIAFIGLGNMGSPMAGNLVKAGHQVIGFDRSNSVTSAASALGVQIAPTAAFAARTADVIMTMLPAGAQVRAVWSELVPASKPGALLVDCSTVDVDSARAVHALAEKSGRKSLDAPVSGGTGGAKGATLTFMVGGTAEAFAAGKAILEAMGKKVVHCGGAGAGQAAKICNNMILGISMIAVGEAFVLGEKLGLSHQALFDVASTSSGQCWSLTTYCPVPGPVPTSPANNGYQPGFAADLMLKDLRLAQEAAAASGAATPLGASAAQLYSLFQASGGGDKDFSGIINILRGLEAKH